jgi:hypothetical protein
VEGTAWVAVVWKRVEDEGVTTIPPAINVYIVASSWILIYLLKTMMFCQKSIIRKIKYL